MKRILLAILIGIALILIPAGCGTGSVTTLGPQGEGTTATASEAQDVSVQIDAGPASTVKLSDAWSRAGAAGGFESDSSTLSGLDLEIDADGYLLAIRAQALTNDSRLVFVEYRGEAAASPATRKVDLTVSVGESGGGMAGAQPDVARALAAIDAVGGRQLIAPLTGTVGASYYSVGLLPAKGAKTDRIDDRMAAYGWNGRSFDPVEPGNSARVYDSRHLYLAVYAAQPVLGQDGDTTATMATSSEPVALVIPLP